MFRLKRKLVIVTIILVLIVLFSGKLSNELNRMNNNLKRQNTINKEIDVYKKYSYNV